MTAGTSGTSLRLERADLPATCHSAARVARDGRVRTRRLVAVELISLVLAGVVGLWAIPVLAAAGGVFFVVFLAASVLRAFFRVEDAWYLGRAGAESVRTLAWRFAVGGVPFQPGQADDAASRMFLDRVAAVLGQLEGLVLAPTRPDDRELTAGMRTVRASSFAARRTVYLRDRISHQIAWYTAKAGAHDRAARRWFVVSVAASLAGIGVAAIRTSGTLSDDWLGVCSAVATAAIAWNQLNQHRTLVSAYRLTARELAIVRDRGQHVDEADWATFVADAEDAVSREHTMWLARHGHPGLRSD
jgi:uncharacterized membrane protein YfcA